MHVIVAIVDDQRRAAVLGDAPPNLLAERQTLAAADDGGARVKCVCVCVCVDGVSSMVRVWEFETKVWNVGHRATREVRVVMMRT